MHEKMFLEKNTDLKKVLEQNASSCPVLLSLDNEVVIENDIKKFEENLASTTSDDLIEACDKLELFGLDQRQQSQGQDLQEEGQQGKEYVEAMEDGDALSPTMK